MNIIDCGTCGNKAAESVTTDVTSLKECKIIVDNVPCYNCEKCGETMYLDSVAENIERIVRLLKNDMGAIIYTDYAKCLSSVSIKTA
ncbi:MAG: YgiT-type zinc finger protein [Oscillospiraceae bacterium]|nr:YgiT-type zinc finger protein [Oscillospiraceae bacterium]